MERNVEHIINSINIEEPYVWKLQITQNEFDVLEQCALKIDKVSTKYDAQLIIVYLSEWYKRCYKSGNQSPVSTEMARNSWRLSGINIDKYVYCTDNGTHLWQYSIFVLGGLAIKHELSRNDKGKFLKVLCRIYHGEEYTLEKFDEENRAFAFRKSIILKHSIYEYLRYILNGKYSGDGDTITLLKHIKTANDEVLKSKFRFEWVIKNDLSSVYMQRRLRVWLKPEEVGGGLHQYLNFDRILLWGIPNPENLKSVHISLRWLYNDIIVQDIDKANPLIAYSNSGNSNGFVSWGINKYAVSRDIPSQRFTQFQVVAFDDNGNEYIAQEESATTWMQLWRIDPYKDDWSSNQKSQSQTAVIFNDAWSVDSKPDYIKPFKQSDNVSHLWNWCYIASSITITDFLGTTKTLYNRTGYDQVFIKLYKDTIQYVDGGFIEYSIEDEEEGTIEEKYPLLFSKSDIGIRHFATKDAIVNVEVEYEEDAKYIEFKTDSGHYVEWNESQIPPYGIIQLRTYNRDIEFKLKCIHLPQPIERQCEDNYIVYYNLQGEKCIYQDSISCDGNPLLPFVEIQIESISIKVIRPTTIKEIYLNESIHCYCKGGNKIIPYVLKDRIRIVDFSEQGYKMYDCKRLGFLYNLLSENTCSLLHYWDDGIVWESTLLDENAPQWLLVCIGNCKEDISEDLHFLKWNLYDDEPPMVADYDCPTQMGDIVFQNLSVPNEDFINIAPRIGKPNPFKAKKIKEIELKCFDIACQYHIYFTVFQPIRQMIDEKKLIDKLYKPLKEKRGGKLDESDIVNLKRLADEFRLSFDKLGITFND